MVRKSLYADECNSKQTRISFARILVEVDITQDIPESIEIMDPSGWKFTQKVAFEWKPEYCKKCLKVGHNCANQPAIAPRREDNRAGRGRNKQQPAQRWVRKAPVANVTIPPPTQVSVGTERGPVITYDGSTYHVNGIFIDDKVSRSIMRCTPQINVEPVLE